MYEILNIIQSVGLVTRIRASFYRWEGYNHMTATLEKLKEEGMRKYGKKTGVKNTLSSKNDIKSSIESPIKMNKKKAVATSLGERFIQIFLCNVSG
jgi:hypothetical protein